jgi:uncharacterized membrane protein
MSTSVISLSKLRRFNAPLASREHTSVNVPSIFWISVGLILILSVAVRFWNLGEANYWTDEALTEFRARAS